MKRSLQYRKSMAESSNISSFGQNYSLQTEVRHFFKIILLGDAGVGKTAILKQFLEEKFEDNYACTISPDYKSKSILIDDNAWVEMIIWDTCGQERYRTLTRQYYRDTKGNIFYNF